MSCQRRCSKSARIIWMQDLDPMSNGGGAQLNDRGMIVEGLKRGHDISILTPENQAQVMLDQSDFLILSNVSRFDPSRFGQIPNRYAVFHHDWLFRCRWRLFFPMNEKCLKDCPQAPQWAPVMKNAALHIFLSPLHYRLNAEYFGEAVSAHILVPSSVNPDRWYDIGKPGRKGTGNVNGLLPFKGRANHLKYAREHPDEKITFLGGNENPAEQLPPNVSVVGTLPDAQMPGWYNDFEQYMELPGTPQPFNRTVVEAYLCGCKVRANELVGAFSWPWMRDSRSVVAQKLKEAPSEFWKGLESVL